MRINMKNHKNLNPNKKNKCVQNIKLNDFDTIEF